MLLFSFYFHFSTLFSDYKEESCSITCDGICEQVWSLSELIHYIRTNDLLVVFLKPIEGFSGLFLHKFVRRSSDCSGDHHPNAQEMIIRMLMSRSFRNISLNIWTFSSSLEVTGRLGVHRLQPLLDLQKIMFVVLKQTYMTIDFQLLSESGCFLFYHKQRLFFHGKLLFSHPRDIYFAPGIAVFIYHKTTTVL